MSKRKYSIHKAPGDRLTDREREMLGQAWNNYINGGHPISVRKFAANQGVPEYEQRGARPARTSAPTRDGMCLFMLFSSVFKSVRQRPETYGRHQ